jgi:putative PEP-CTERM system TPR-repeat lipoprotein
MGRIIACFIVVAVAMGGGPSLAITSEEFVERADLQRLKGDLRAAIIELKNALQKNRNNAAARVMLGRVYVDAGDGASAEKELSRAETLGVRRADLAKWLGEAWLLQGKYQKVVDDLAIAGRARRAQRAALLYLRGEARRNLKDAAGAEADFRAALGDDPKSANGFVGLGRLAFDAGKLADAETALAKAEAAQPDNYRVLRLKGELKFRRAKYPEAERIYRRLVEARPWDPARRLLLGYTQIALKNYDEAIQNIGAALERAPRHLAANHLRALAAYQTKDYKTAKFHIDQALAVLPSHLPSQLLAGATNFALGNNEVAYRHLAGYLADVPSNKHARRLLGATLLRLGQPGESRKVLELLKVQAQDDAQLLALIGMAAVRSGNLEEGKRYFERLVEVQPDNPAAQAQLGAVQLALGQADKGIVDLEKALERDPNLDRALISLIVAYSRDKQFALALAAAKRLRDKNPKSVMAWNLIGISHGGLDDVEAAARAFGKALEIQPGAPDPAANLAAFKIAQGKPDEARGLYDQVLEHNPDHLGTLLKLAKLERQLKRPVEELRLLERAARRHPESRLARITLGRAYMKRGAPQKALVATLRLLDQAPNNAAILQVVGEAQLRIGDTEKALDTFRRLVEAKPDHAASHFHLARAFEAAKTFDKADIELQKTLLLDPGNVPAKFARARILVRRGGLELAKGLLMDLKSAYPDEPAILALEARIALVQDRPKEAVGLLRRALEKRDDANLVILLARAQARAGAVDDGLGSLRDWLGRFPDDIRVRFVLAQKFTALKRFVAAKTEYQAVLARAPKNVAALNNLAWVHWRLGSTQEGLVHARRAMELAPKNPGIMDTLGIILLKQGNSAEALALLRRAHEKLPRHLEVQLHFAKALVKEGKTGEAKSLLIELVGSERKFADRAEAEALLRRLP